MVIIMVQVNKCFNNLVNDYIKIKKHYIYHFNKLNDCIFAGYTYPNETYYFEYLKLKNNYTQKYYNLVLNYTSHVNNSEKKHNPYGPYCIVYNKNGTICEKQYYLNNEKYSYENYIKELDKIEEISKKEYYFINNEEYSYENYIKELDKIV